MFIGPNDMSTSLGVPDDYSNKKYLKVIADIIKRCEARKIPVMVHQQTIENLIQGHRPGRPLHPALDRRPDAATDHPAGNERPAKGGGCWREGDEGYGGDRVGGGAGGTRGADPSPARIADLL